MRRVIGRFFLPVGCSRWADGTLGDISGIGSLQNPDGVHPDRLGLDAITYQGARCLGDRYQGSSYQGARCLGACLYIEALPGRIAKIGDTPCARDY